MASVTITKENIGREVLQSDKPVLLDFWAAWCLPCRMVSYIIEDVSDELKDIKVGKVNIDEEPELADKYNITSIPTLAVVKDGKVVNTSVGLKPKASIIKMLEV